MQVSGNNSSLPLSTQIIRKTGPAAQAPDTSVPPEQVNSARDRASDRATQTQASQQQTQTERRTNATQLYSASSQQKQIDTYLAVANEGKFDSNSGSKPTALQLNDAAAASERDNVENLGRQRPPETAQPVKPEHYLISTSA